MLAAKPTLVSDVNRLTERKFKRTCSVIVERVRSEFDATVKRLTLSCKTWENGH